MKKIVYIVTNFNKKIYKDTVEWKSIYHKYINNLKGTENWKYVVEFQKNEK